MLVTTILGGLAFMAVSAATQDAQAAFVDATKYCSHADYATSGGGLSTGAVQFTVDGGGSYGATDCYGAFGIKEAKDSTVGGKEIDVLTAIWGGGLTYLGKSNVDGSFEAGSSLGGLQITNITATTTGWTISWVGAAGTLPMTIDLAVMLKAGSGTNTGTTQTALASTTDPVNDAGSWWLPKVYLHNGSSTGSGAFVIEWLNKGGQTPDLSNLSLAARLARDPRIFVPEPGTLGLLGFGLAGLWAAGMVRRRTRASSERPD
jgi:hypothetical protein